MEVNKNINKKNIIVIAVAIVAAILVLVFVFTNPLEENKSATDKVVLNESGEASYLNLSVPSSNQKEDSLSMLEKLEKIKMDSLNRAKLNSTGLQEYEVKKNSGASNENYNSLKPKETTSNHESYTSSTTVNEKKYSSAPKKTKSANTTASKSYSEPVFDSWDKPSEKSSSIEKTGTVEKTSGFFKSKTTKSTTGTKTKNDNAISIFASVHTNQTIRNNERVKLITTKEFYYKGKKYEANTVVYGFAKIQPNRLLIEISKINQTDIKLDVYDSEDSGKGLYILTPNLNASLQKELKKEGIVQADDLGNLGSIPFSKTILSVFEKKVKEEKVELLNNYKVIIKIADEK
jgi:hypothetical protein